MRQERPRIIVREIVVNHHHRHQPRTLMLPLADSRRASGAALAVDALLLPRSSTSIAASRP
jgi:hypothetical protein